MGASGSKLATAGSPLAGVDQAEIDKLPSALKLQLETFLEEQAKYVEELKGKCEIDSEQRSFEIEKELIASNSKLQEAGQLIQSLKSENVDLESKYKDTSQRYRDLQEEFFAKERIWVSAEGDLREKKSCLEAEVHDLAYMLEKKNAELERLNGEWRQMSEKVNESNKARLEALAKSEEALSDVALVRNREGRLKQEFESIRQQKEWLEGQLNEKSDQLLSSAKDRSSETLLLQSKLAAKTDEVEHLEKTVEARKEAQDDLTNKIDDYLQKLKESRDELSQLDERYRNELYAQEKLVQIYKESHENSQKKLTELVNTNEELQSLVKLANQTSAELQNKCSADEANYQTELHLREEQLSQLMKELTNANELLEAARKKGLAPLSESQIESLSPSAAKVSNLLKSGMTLTQIYSEYATASEQLQLEKEENQKLNDYIDQIMQEIEEKAPILKKQRDEYVEAMSSITKLTTQLETAMQECEKSRASSAENSRRSGELKRANHRLQQQCTDLSLQVKFLLKELEEARGRVVRDVDPLFNVSSSSEVSSSSQIISQNLVTFRGIEELQEQNQKLLAVVRDLSEKQEQQEVTNSQKGANELREELERACEELENMRDARNRQIEMVESIMQQRDMYRTLLAQAGTAHAPISPSHTSTPAISQAAQQHSASPELVSAKQPASRSLDMDEGSEQGQGEGVTQQVLEDTQAALKQLQEDFNMYRTEKAANSKILSDQVEKFREENSSMKIQNSRLSSQLDFMGERFKVLQGNVEGYKKEISATREKNQSLTATIIKLEQTVMTLTEELRSTRERLTRAEVQSQSLRAEKQVLVGSEARLSQERESLIREQRSRDLLMANLQTIQNNLERAEFDTKVKLEARIENYEKENLVLRRRVEGSDLHTRQLISTLEKQLTDSKQECITARATQETTNRQLKFTKQNEEDLKCQLSKVESQLAAAESRMSTLSQQQSEGKDNEDGDQQSEKVKELETELADYKSQVQSLKSQLSRAREHLEQYKTISTSVETSLKQHNEATRQYQEEMETKAAQLTSTISELESKVSSLEEERNTLQSENSRIDKDTHESDAELRHQLATLQHELEDVMSEREQAISNQQSAQNDLTVQAQLTQEMQEKYERELMHHASDVQSLTSLKQEAQQHSLRMASVEEEAKKAQDTLAASQEAWKEQEKLLEEDRNKIKERLDSIQKQNVLLYEELDSMSNQMVALQNAHQHADAHTQQLAETVAKETETLGPEKSADHLLEVIRFLRKEKEIAEARFDVVQAESNRLKQQVEHVNKQCAETTATLSEERQRAQIRVETAAQHSELMRKVESLNLLQDSNRILREDKDRLLQNLQEHEVKVKALEEDMTAVQVAKRDLTCQLNTLAAEKTVLKGEVETWQARTTHLVEECNKVDPMELERTKEERDELTKQVSDQKEEIHKLQADIIAVTSHLTAARSEMEAETKQLIDTKGQLETMKADVIAKDSDIELKEKTINQLKRVGRKWKTQAEEKQKQLDEMEVKAEEQKGTQSSLNLLQEKLKVSEEKLKQTEGNLKVAQDRLKVIEGQSKVTGEKLKKAEEDMAGVNEKLCASETAKGETQKEKEDAEKKMKAAEDKLTEVAEETSKLKNEVNKLSEVEKKIAGEKEELEKKYMQLRTIVSQAKSKIFSQKTELDERQKEVQSLKSQLGQSGESPSTSTATASQGALEAKVGELEQELSEARLARTNAQTELEGLKRDHSEMEKRLQLLQRQLENQQKQGAPAASRPTLSAPPVERVASASAPEVTAMRTANIRPTPVVAQARHVQSAPVQPVRSTTAETRAMASIRPMATVASTTPTATVMPTSLSVQDSESVAPVISLVQPGPTQRPTQQVQPVSPHVDEPAPGQVPVTSVENTEVEVPPTAVQSSSSSVSTASSSGGNIAGSSGGNLASTSGGNIAPLSQSLPSTSTAPMTSTGPPSPPQPSTSKRSREEATSSQDDTESEAEAVPLKKTRVVDTTSEPEDSTPAQSSPARKELATDADTLPVDATETDTQIMGDTLDVEEMPLTSEEYSEGQVVTEEEEEEEEDDTDVIEAVDEVEELEEGDGDVVIVDDEDEEDEEDNESGGYVVEQDVDDEEEEDEEEEEGQYGYDDEEEEEDYDQEEEGDEDEGTQEEMEEEEDDDDDIVIVEDDEDEEEQAPVTMTTQPSSGSGPSQTSARTQSTAQPVSVVAGVGATGSSTAALQRPAFARLTSQTSVPGRSQLTPFPLSEAGFELGDDGIVPSTPTLFVPRRTDGFAEAVSSPGVQSGFNFGGNSDGNTDFAQLASQAVGMDDTRIDLSQFDDMSGNRSQSTTPVSQAPPTINVVEASPPRTDSETTQVVTAETEQQAPEVQEQEAAEVTGQSDPQIAPSEAGGSEGAGPSEPAQTSSSASATGSGEKDSDKPKTIQRITWEDPNRQSGVQNPPSQAPLQGMAILPIGQQQWGQPMQQQQPPQRKFRGQGPPFRSRPSGRGPYRGVPSRGGPVQLRGSPMGQPRLGMRGNRGFRQNRQPPF